MKRRAALAAAALATMAPSLVTACSTSSGVTRGTAVEITTATIAPTTPATTTPATTTPTASATTDNPPTETDGSVPAPSTTPASAPDETAAPSTTIAAGQPGDPDGIGDALFPALGNPGVDVQHYDVVLQYDPARDALRGSVELTVTMTEARASFTLDSAGPDVDAVTVDGAAAAFVEDEPELRITPASPVGAGDTVDVRVDYHLTPDPGGSASGLPAGWFHTAGGSYVLNEPDGARSWLPSNDHPSDKATWTFDLTVPEGTTAVANGVLETDAPAGSGEHRWVWRQDDPMATYLVQVLTGDYELITGTGPDGLPLVSAVLRDDRATMQVYVDEIGEQIDWFDDQFGPFPLAGYGIAMTDSEPGLAMETQGRSLFSRGDFSGTLGYTEQLLLSHELAHQWFGDAVSPASWRDIWLNESFATYAQWMWLDRAGLSDLERDADAALRQKATIGGRPTGDPGVADLFGYNSYDGGAVVVHALRRTLGDAAFSTLLQRWVSEHRFQSRTTADLVALASEIAGRDLSGFFDTWLYAPVPPRAYPSPGAELSGR